ncbi:Glycosyl transferase family 2 [Lachnospiraceae bacterium XPB1003]|nr:Glycosyl transferase family 2 [Lachnospiraceae bacterium XPB1003]
MKGISFSIVMPFYNTNEKMFDRCISSVLSQEYSNFEVIIVNDGSSEEYKEKLEMISKSDSRVRVINKENEGSAIARNVGINESKCDYVMFMDADDALMSYSLEQAAHIINKLGADYVMGLVRKTNEQQIDSIIGTESNEFDVIENEEEKNALLSHMLGYRNQRFICKNGYLSDGPWSRVVKREIVQSSLFSEEAFWNDDTIWNIKTLKKCNRVVIVKDLWYKYLINDGSKIRKFRKNCPEEFAFRTKQELDLGHELWPMAIKGVYNRIFNDIIILSRTFLFHPSNEMSGREKYKSYLNCIHQDAYMEAAKGVDLTIDRGIKRLIKGIFRFFIVNEPNIISYELLKFYIKFKAT